MAMINCPECGQNISDKAKKCIHCGAVLIEEKPKTKICGECGNENPVEADECSFCGCPFEEEQIVSEVNTPIKNAKNSNSKKNIIKIAILALVVVAIGLVIYNVKIVKPKKTYEEAVALLEKGKYEDADKLFDTIKGYNDVDIIQEQLIYESYAYSVINSIKQNLKNPDSFQPYEIMFYSTEKEEDVIKKAESLENTETEVLGTESEEISYPVCIMHYGAQNGFGGNTTGYLFAMYSTENEGYEILGTCDSLDEEDYDKDDEDDLVDLITCGLINIYLEDEEREPIGSIDMGRLKTVLKNDAYSTIKIIE
ncbi:MAG: hypothetical protein J6A92_02580 [Lachnospiraceae bacterium]|nr:hypothetical protein [Lachnospiraceae bacterium]